MDMNFTSKGVGNAALATGIIGTVGTGLGLLSSHGGLNGLLGGTSATSDAGTMAGAVANAAAEKIMGVGVCSEDKPVTRYELGLQQQIAAKDQQIAILQSENFTNTKIADVYERLKSDINTAEKEQQAWNAQQSVNNAVMSAAIATNTQSIAGLSNTIGSITKTVVPNSSVCPGWGAVTVNPTCCSGTGTTIA